MLDSREAPCELSGGARASKALVQKSLRWPLGGDPHQRHRIPRARHFGIDTTDWVLPVLFHLLWLGWLTGDLSRPLGYGTILIVAADLARDTGLSRRGGPSGKL